MAEFGGFGEESKHKKKRKNQKDYVKASLKAKRTREFEGVKSKIKGAFVVQKERNSEILDETYINFVPEDYFRIHHGIVAVQDKTSKEIVLVVRCMPFEKMTTDEYEEYKKITCTLQSMANGASSVTFNGAQRTGQMFAVGWRGGSDSGLTLGRYVPHRRIQHDASKLENWKHQQTLQSEISTIYGKKFCTLAPSLFQQTKIEVMETKVPTLAEMEFSMLPAEGAAFCSNLTYTTQDFSNSFHRDGDFNSYTFGMWAPTFSENGRLASKLNGFKCEGGQFLVGSYKVCVDFNACDGIVEMIWCGKSDFHSTIPSITIPNFTRMGTSLQVSDSLVQQMKKLMEMHTKGVDISKKVRGVNEIVESKLKRLK